MQLPSKFQIDDLAYVAMFSQRSNPVTITGVHFQKFNESIGVTYDVQLNNYDNGGQRFGIHEEGLTPVGLPPALGVA